MANNAASGRVGKSDGGESAGEPGRGSPHKSSLKTSQVKSSFKPLPFPFKPARLGRRGAAAEGCQEPGPPGAI
jgi:hypothetical protein